MSQATPKISSKTCKLGGCRGNIIRYFEFDNPDFIGFCVFRYGHCPLEIYADGVNNQFSEDFNIIPIAGFQRELDESFGNSEDRIDRWRYGGAGKFSSKALGSLVETRGRVPTRDVRMQRVLRVNDSDRWKRDRTARM
jgi:hypothetical protein